MNFRRNIEEDDGAFQLAPMIDIVFIMLTFFVAIFGMQQNEREMEVKPPLSSSGTIVARNPYDIVVNIKQDGTLMVNRKVWPLSELQDRLRMIASATEGQCNVLIRADAMTFHQNVVNVMDACVGVGITRFSFVTVSRDKGAN